MRPLLAVLLVFAVAPASSALARDIYVTSTGFATDNVSIIDSQTDKVVGPPVDVGSRPRAIAITPDGKLAYVANFNDDSVSVIDTRTRKTVGAPIGVGVNPRSIAIGPSGQFAYVANQGRGTVSVIKRRRSGLGSPHRSSAHVLPARNGADVGVGNGTFVFASGGDAVAVSSGRGRTTTYSTRAHITRSGVVADFGGLGRIDLDFEPSGPPLEQKPSRFCHGAPQLTWEGVFTGTVEFRGRYGFRPFHDRSFVQRGSFTHTPRMACHIPGESRPYEPQSGNGVELWAAACNGRSFSVQGERPMSGRRPGWPRPISYSANASLRVGPVQVGRR